MKKWLLLLILPLLVITLILIQHRDSMDMTFRQKMLRSIYPLLTRVTKKAGSNGTRATPSVPVDPPVSLYDRPLTMIEGDTFRMERFKGRKLLIVNTASDCGYTGQYASLQALQDRYPDQLTVIGFPANDFKQQEKGSDADIAAFCKRNYGVSFPLSTKVSVVRGKHQDPIFHWLSDPAQNGWNNRQPVWNFTKYLIDEQGRLSAYFGPAIDPLDPEFIAALGLQ